MKKILLIIIFFITGCTYTDIKDLAIIKKIGINYQDKYIVYVELYDNTKNNEKTNTLLISYGTSFNDALNNVKKKISKKILLSHIDLLILDSNLKEKNYDEIINYAINSNIIINNSFTIIKDDINNLLNHEKNNELENYIKNNTNSNNITKLSFEKLINSYLERTTNEKNWT